MKSFSAAVVTVARYHPADVAAALALVQLVPSALTSWYSCPLRIGIACASCGTVVALSNAAARYRRFDVDIYVPPTMLPNQEAGSVPCASRLSVQGVIVAASAGV